MSEEKPENDAQIFKYVAMQKIADTIIPIIYFGWGMVTGIMICIALWSGWN